MPKLSPILTIAVGFTLPEMGHNFTGIQKAFWRDWFCVFAQSCLSLWNPLDCSPAGSSVHGISQARILGWVAISCSTGPRFWCFKSQAIICMTVGMLCNISVPQFPYLWYKDSSRTYLKWLLKLILFIYLLIFGWAESLLVSAGFL